jgi:hypothetical protein
MVGQDWDSQGYNRAHINVIMDAYNASSVPVSMDDAWGENRPSREYKNHLPPDIRRAFWKCLIAGGVGGLVRGSDANDDGFLFTDIQSDLGSEQWLRHINPFLVSRLGDTFGTMVQSATFVSGAYALADPQRTKILYFLMGRNDKFDSGTGGSITVKLTGVSGSFNAIWFDTRTGNESSAGVLNGGTDHTVSPPSTDDWVLLLEKSGSVDGIGSKGLNNTESHGRIRIIPNPVQDNALIYYQGTGQENEGSIAVFNMTGRKMLCSIFDHLKTANSINTKNLPNGNYVLVFNGIQGKETVKFSKTR